MVKKISMALALAMSVTALTGCGSHDDDHDHEETSSTLFVLEQLEHMKADGYKSIELDYVPERIVSLSTAPVLALYEMGADLIMVPQTTVVTYPNDLGAEVITAVTSNDFDLELIIDADPGLVLIPSSAYEEYGSLLESAGIPCYVTALSHGDLNAYELIKEETKVFTNAFAVDASTQAKADEVMLRIDQLDDKIGEAKLVLQGRTFLGAMVSGGTNFYVQQETSTLGSLLKMLGFENAYDSAMGANMTPLSLETVVGLDIDLMIFIAATMSMDESEEIAKTAMADQPEVWDSVSAVAEDNVLYLTTNYWIFGGLQVIDSVSSLIDLLLE